MFDITGEHIARLGDADLRTLVARLALAELASQRLPCSAVTAGGHQDAKDGGIDVRVQTDGEMPEADFVPRKNTGFQVKRPDMPHSDIIKEMRPDPDKRLRPSIARLAAEGGAYIVVSSQGSVADQPLQARRQALRDGLAGCPDADRLYTDFYDRERLATWTNRYPGAAMWLRDRVGVSLSGWRTIGSWSDVGIAEGHGYLVSKDARVFGERAGGRDTLTIPSALDELRSKLQAPGQCVRLIGLSGVGKTRFVEALFEPGVGEAPPLDPALSVYTDYAEDIDPSARAMARRLVGSGNRAILVVDNCNPTIHADLATICTARGSGVSLLTIEYDVRDDEPERTDVYRLTSGSADALGAWLRREFPHLSQIDRSTIARFSDGNFRVARALADTVRRGESLGNLRSQDLFERLFFQRNAPDHRLLRDAEALALVYSFDGEDESQIGELAALGALADRSVRDLFEAAGELRSRGIVQTRGRWRAVLPQAIANRLAANALRRIPPGAFDAFWKTAPERLLKSMSRRLGYLHDSAEARATVDRWLDPAGPLGNLLEGGEVGLEVAANLAPASPRSVLIAMQTELDSLQGAKLTAPSSRFRHKWIRLLRALAYTPESFDSAALLLSRFVSAEPEFHNSDAAREPFAELFHIHLSGTHASPTQRVALARALLRSAGPGERRAGAVALDGLLKTSHFSSSASFDFGARPRDFGWHPTTQEDITEWFAAAVMLAMEATASLQSAKRLLGQHVRGLWRIDGVRAAIEAAADRFVAETSSWLDGWIGLRAYVRWDAPDGVDERTAALIERLKPVNLLERSRAVVLSHSAIGADVTDGEVGDVVTAWQRASELAMDLGKAMADQEADLHVFLPEVLAENGHRAFEFGRGLALATPNARATWAKLSTAYAAIPQGSRYVTALGGFVSELNNLDPAAASEMLEAALGCPALRQMLPYLQARAVLDVEGLDRLRRLAESAAAPASSFADLASGRISSADTDPLVVLLHAIEALEGGTEIVIEILHLRLRNAKDERKELPPALLSYGRSLLLAFKIGKNSNMRDYRLGELVEFCFSGEKHRNDVREFCERLQKALNTYEIHAYDCHQLITALLKTHPVTTLDCLVDSPGDQEVANELFEASVGCASPFEATDPETLTAWAQIAPARRFCRLGAAMPIFKVENQDATGLSPTFLSVLAHAPDKAGFLGTTCSRVYPDGWYGSLATTLEHRKAILGELSELGDADVSAWLVDANREIDDWIEAARESESRQEESFE